MSSEKNNRIESDGFLDKYEPIDLQKDSFFLELKEINPKFYDGCLQVQDDILEGRVNESDFKDVEDFMAGNINKDVLEKIGGYWNFGEFVRTHLFRVRQKWIDATPRGAALKELETQLGPLDELFQMYKKSLGGKVVGGATVSDEGIIQLKDFIRQKGNQFPEAVGLYLSEISNSLPNNIFLAHLISFMKDYRIKVGIDTAKKDFNAALAA